MSNPNRSVYLARNRQTVVAKELHTYDANQVEALKQQLRDEGYMNVRATSYKYGPRPNAKNGWKQSYGYVVRAYVPVDSNT